MSVIAPIIKRNITIVKSNEALDLENFKNKNIKEEIAWDDLFAQKEEEKEKKRPCCDNPYIPTGNVCHNCGIVLNSVNIDQKAEWNNYGDDGSGAVNPARCGNPVNFLLPKSSMATEIEGNSRLAQRALWMRMNSEEKALLSAFTEIEKRCRTHFSKRVIESSKYMFKRVRDLSSGKTDCPLGMCRCKGLLPCSCKNIAGISNGFLDETDSDENGKLELFTPNVIKQSSGIRRGEHFKGVMANCVDRSAKNAHEGAVSEQIISSIFGIDTKHMSEGRKYVTNILDGALVDTHKKSKAPVRITARDLANRLCVKLKMTKEQIKDVLKIIDFLKKNKFLTSKATASVTAGCIYYTSIYHNLETLENLTVERIGIICGVSKNTIVKIYDEIEDIIKKSIEKVEEHKKKLKKREEPEVKE